MDTIEIIVSEADTRITATVVRADAVGTPVAPTPDPPDLMLVKDLDLRIKAGTVKPGEQPVLGRSRAHRGHGGSCQCTDRFVHNELTLSLDGKRIDLRRGPGHCSGVQRGRRWVVEHHEKFQVLAQYQVHFQTKPEAIALLI